MTDPKPTPREAALFIIRARRDANPVSVERLMREVWHLAPIVAAHHLAPPRPSEEVKQVVRGAVAEHWLGADDEELENFCDLVADSVAEQLPGAEVRAPGESKDEELQRALRTVLERCDGVWQDARDMMEAYGIATKGHAGTMRKNQKLVGLATTLGDKDKEPGPSSVRY